MASEENTISFNLHPSPDGALDILVGAEIDRAAAERILGIVPEQHDNEPGHTKQNSGSNEASKTSFEGRMMAMMEGFSQKLNNSRLVQAMTSHYHDLTIMWYPINGTPLQELITFSSSVWALL